MKSALYHQIGKQPIAFSIAKEHDNGTVDLCDDRSRVLITECVITANGEYGTCTLIPDKAEAAKAGQSGPHGVILPERTEALRLAALAIDARKLADDAKGQQGVGALREAAEAAEKAAKEADTAADAAEAAAASA